MYPHTNSKLKFKQILFFVKQMDEFQATFFWTGMKSKQLYGHESLWTHMVDGSTFSRKKSPVSDSLIFS